MNDGQERHPVERLTDEQLEVLRLVGRGYKSKQIARMVQVSHFAVNSRIDRAVERLGVADRFEAGRLVIDFERPTYDAITHADDSVHLRKPGVFGEKEEPDGRQPGGFPWPFATSSRQDGLSTKQRLMWAVVGIPCLVMLAWGTFLSGVAALDTLKL
jgi:DNA-binding CsgD family transcriptional regulator